MSYDKEKKLKTFTSHQECTAKNTLKNLYFWIVLYTCKESELWG